MAKETIKEMLKMIDAKIEHIEDITADNRAVIIKLVKQSNEVVQFLRELNLEIEEAEKVFSERKFLNVTEKETNKKAVDLKELIDEFMDKRKDLKELEAELKKNKDQITPGQIGEA